MDDLEEDLTCSVCYGLFTDPRVLPCSHTFCKSCLERVMQVSVDVSIWRPLRLPLKCPSCRSVAELPTNGLDALPTNVCLSAIVEKYQRPRSAACPEHPPQPLNVYCVQDRQLICGVCLTVGRHRGHAIDDLQTAHARERAGQARLMERLSGERWEDVCSLTQRLRLEKKRSEGLIQDDREFTAQFFHNLELVLARKREEFLQTLERASARLACAYDPLVEQLERLQEEHGAVMALSSGVESEESPLVYLETVRELRERVEALMRTPLPEIPSVQLTPRAEPFLREHWCGLSIRGLGDGPVPEICGPAQCRRLRSSSSAAVLIAMLLLTGLCLHHCAEEPLRGVGTLLFGPIHNSIMTLHTFTATLGENIYQDLLSFLKTLHWC
ncbi:tripartite motif-containing protein 59 [Pimephales promelas]|uniref:tripartite motif-containing protein 59 n=1 Tax=Pimephales promelas TaxID=90988 RepID=UPI001955BD85|nr:tripartite motif-containing protein 59 [Pimephales promelas]